jgi:starvation-inducible DNA-binding protein
MEKPHIGLEEKERFGSAEILNRVLSDEFVIYTKTRNYHWNVTGPRFGTLHRFFEELYELSDELMDEVAERVRTLGFFAFGSLEQFAKMTRIQEVTNDIPDEDGMIKGLLTDHETLIRHLREDAQAILDKYRDAGSNDFLVGLMEKHEKMAWMLRAYLPRK